MDRVFAGKVWGAWYLSEATRRPASWTSSVSTSSISSVWGSCGQTAYSAANAFLDGLAWRLREQGVPGISVNFGPWSAGMADQDARAQLDRRGVRTLSPADALAGMAELMAAAGTGTRHRGGGADRLGPLPADLPAVPGKRSFLAQVAA